MSVNSRGGFPRPPAKTESVKSIIIVGVGGQGTLLASRIMGDALVSKGYDVKVSEVHGMSQRGGSVITYVRYGDRVFSPVIENGEADIILAFEELEAARYLSFLKPTGTVITSTQQIDPMPVITGAAEYPKEVILAIESLGIPVRRLDALELAKQAGSIKAVNVVLIGALAKDMDIEKEIWLKAIENCVPSKFLEMNKTAFELGYNSII